MPVGMGLPMHKRVGRCMSFDLCVLSGLFYIIPSCPKANLLNWIVDAR